MPISAGWVKFQILVTFRTSAKATVNSTWKLALAMLVQSTWRMIGRSIIPQVPGSETAYS